MIKSNQNFPNVLIVDDNDINLLLLVGILENNYNVTTINNSYKALELIKNNKYDLILLDVMMDEIDGFEICKILKSDTKTSEIPIIFITALADKESIEKGFEIGAVDYITKPFNKHELSAKVKNHIRLKITKELIKEELIERLNAEKKIKEQESKFRSIFENSTDIIIILKEDISILNANNSALEYLKYSKDEITKLKFGDIIDDYTYELELNFRKVIEFNFTFKKEFYLKSSTNNLFPVELNANLIQYSSEKIILCMIRDISERKQIETKLVSTIFQTEETERARFSKDIHDGLGALLSSVNIYLNLIWSEKLSQAEFENYFIYTKGLLDEAILATREIANNLRPTVLTRYGLIASLNSLILKINNTNKIKILLETNILEEVIDKDTEIILFRIISELINNTLKHANASSINIILKFENQNITLKFQDNGTGFDINDFNNNLIKGNGLKNIFSRIKSIEGTTSIKSKKGEGLKVNLSIPYKN